MRLPLILAATVTAAFFAAPTSPAKANYCLNEDGSNTCGFISMQQCMESQAGRGGRCELDTTVARPSDSAR